MKQAVVTSLKYFFLTVSLAIGTPANTVSFDPSFNGTGYGLYPAVPAPAYSIGKSMAVQTDGKIVMAGHIVNNQAPQRVAVMRLNSDGSFDSLFGTGGVVLTDIVSLIEIVKVLIQPDGKIVVAGTAGTATTAVDFLLLRYNANGTLDTTFNSTGFVTQTVNGFSIDYLYDIARQTDGKIVAVGRTIPFGFISTLEYDFAAIRFNPNGSLDSGFNGNGVLVLPSVNVEESAFAVLVQPDEKILIGGLASVGANLGNFVLVRRNGDGSPDTAFGSGGKTITNGPSSYQYIQSMAR